MCIATKMYIQADEQALTSQTIKGAYPRCVHVSGQGAHGYHSVM